MTLADRAPVLRCSAALGQLRLAVVAAIADAPLGAPERAGDRAVTGRGTVQLASAAAHDVPGMLALKHLLASRAYDLCRARFELPPPDQLCVQVFPVVMHGGPSAPPGQRSHRDNRTVDGRIEHPIVTAVYYAVCEALVGGELVLHRGHAGQGQSELTIAPEADDLVAFAGDTAHSVQPLRAGTRMSVVVNLYSATASQAESRDAPAGSSARAE